ncbi:hypothetical protein KRX19_11440 [Cardiobacteriaceae bacterium TAE3-ERU3]|nr:hypothetical protein [Cardiobacteriaceae bacterium TAE3-ERU3]
MNPKEQIEKLLSKQVLPVIEKNEEKRKKTQEILRSLGVREGSQFYELYSKYFLRHLDCRDGTPEIIDPLPESFERKTVLTREVWELPENYILFTTGEGEGGYLYETEEEKVWDFYLICREELFEGTLPHWDSFYEFMVWYLTVEDDEE